MFQRLFARRTAATTRTDRRRHDLKEADKYGTVYDPGLPFFMQRSTQ